MSFGLSESTQKLLLEIFAKYLQIEKVVIFGSRAMGHFKNGSDVDLALFGKNLDDLVLKISTELNQLSPSAYQFDIVEYQSITNQQLKEHIDREGKVFYQK